MSSLQPSTISLKSQDFENSTKNIPVMVQQLKHAKDLDLPHYQTDGSVGLDLRAALPSGDITIKPGTIALVDTGIVTELPDGFELQIRSRSGLAYKKQVMVLNSPGTIDTDYRGEIKVILANFGHDDFVVSHGDRIAQAVLSKVWKLKWVDAKSSKQQDDKVAPLSPTQRGTGGFGHTGV